MLNKSDLDPFNAQEAKPYKADPEIVAMTKLVQAFHSDNIAEFERILRDNSKAKQKNGVSPIHEADSISDGEFNDFYIEKINTEERKLERLNSHD